MGTQSGSKHGKCKKEATLLLEADPCALLPLSNLFIDKNIRIWRLMIMICSSWHHEKLWDFSFHLVKSERKRDGVKIELG